MMQPRFAPSGLSTQDAASVSEILQERLAALLDLALILKHVHWNVVGQGFLSIHEMMDDHTSKVRDMIDEVAERIVTLGGIAGGLAGQIVEHRSVDSDYSLGRAPVLAHLGALDKVYDRVAGEHRDAIAEVDEIDPVTGDLLTGHTGVLEMYQWFVRAHLENVDGELSTSDAETELDAATDAVMAPQPGEEMAELVSETQDA